MNTFTLLHTVVSLLPVGFGLAAFARHGGIRPQTRLGRWYVLTMLAGTVSSFGFLPTLGVTPGQLLTMVTLALVLAGVFTLQGRRRAAGYGQTVALTTSFLLLMVFLTTETLKRVPVGHPFATGPADPALVPVRLGLLAAYLVVLGVQLWQVRAARRTTAYLQRLVAYAHA